MNKKQILAVMLFSTLFLGVIPASDQVVGVTRSGNVPRAASANISYPTNGATVSGIGTIEFSANHQGDGIEVYLYIDGTEVGTGNSAGTYTYDWDTTQETDGDHEIKVVVNEITQWWWFTYVSDTAEDIHTVSVNNGGTSDTTPPSISITSPTDGTTLTTGDLTVSWSGSDSDSGINYYEIRLDSGSWINKGTSTSHFYSGLSDGGHSVEVRAYDNAGNSATDSVSFTIDTGSGGDDPIVHTFSDSISQKTGNKHSFNVPTDATSMNVELQMPSGADYDLSLWDASNQRTGGYTPDGDTSQATNIANSDYSGWLEDPEWITVDPVVSFGTWDVSAYSYSGSGTYTITVTINLGGTPDTTAPSITISSPSEGETTGSGVTVSWTGSDSESGIGYYEIQLDSGSWINKGTSTSHSYSGLSDGSHSVNVRAYDNAGNSATDTVSFTVDSSQSGGDGVVRYHAVIVGISDYEAISDLSYCDEDATDWFNHLTNNLGWDSNYITVLGDGHSANYPQYDGLATEYNIKQALNDMVAAADEDDVIMFSSSGHGSGNGYGSSYICAWDCSSGESGQDGDFYDTELSAILESSVASKIHVFIDHCYSGGFGPDLLGMSNAANLYCTTTCTEDGYGYDDPSHNNGAWTYYFLEYAWINHFGGTASTALEDVFDYAAAAYPHSGGDMCQEFDGNTGQSFYLN